MLQTGRLPAGFFSKCVDMAPEGRVDMYQSYLNCLSNTRLVLFICF